MQGVASALGLVLCALVAACGERGAPMRADSARDSMSTRRSGERTAVYVAQITALSDSAGAVRLRDSLRSQGFRAYLTRAPLPAARSDTSPRPTQSASGALWRVRVQPATDSAVARATVFALRRVVSGAEPAMVQDTVALGAAAPGGVRALEMLRVNRGAGGMLARARWALSADRRTILVVDDPAGVENDPVPNGFVFATERGMRRVQVDSVWDVAPSPDWTRAAYGRAYVVVARGADTLPAAAWESLASRVGLSTARVRSASFPASGMSIAFGLAQPGVVELETGERRALPTTGGWRVLWSAHGDSLFAGLAPRRVLDDAPSARWVALDPATGARVGTLIGEPAAADVAWVDGPTLDISVPLDTGARVALPIAGGQVESRGGWIRVRGQVIGPGIALAATHAGRFVAALVPDPSAREFEASHMLVVYTVGG